MVMMREMKLHFEAGLPELMNKLIAIIINEETVKKMTGVLIAQVDGTHCKGSVFTTSRNEMQIIHFIINVLLFCLAFVRLHSNFIGLF